MKTRSLGMLLLLLASAAHGAGPAHVTDADAPRSLPASGPVSVAWSDPAQFTELRYSRNRWDARRGEWVVQLAEHLRKEAAKALPPGQRIDFTITDIKRAGDYEPWHGSQTQDVRIVRDIYPPRISFSFVRHGADGQVIGQGERKLVDVGFLSTGAGLLGGDPLRHEKRLLDDWVRRELRAGRETGTR